ncbi:MAG: universal stress protein [Verrucomicrobiota bacterium]|nr:universal stress protein [Verrucomicrobiota bacterium]
MFKKILLCTDGSSHAQVAQEFALALAKRLNAKVIALFVIEQRILEGPLFADLSGAIGVLPFQAFYPQLSELYHQRARIVLDQFAAKATEAGVECETLEKEGSLVSIVTEEENNCDLVILGKKGENARHTIDPVGHTLESIIRQSIKPCLVVPDKFEMFTTALVAHDGSERSRHALTAGFTLAKDLGLKVTVVSVDDGDTEQAGDALVEATTEARIAGIPVEEQMLYGDPSKEITDLALQQKAGLIVMGAYGHTPIREFILGSTTTRVILKSTVPVLLAR